MFKAISKAMFTLYGIVFFVGTKTLPGRASVHTCKNGDLGAISVTERNCAALISYLESHMSHRSSYYMYTG